MKKLIFIFILLILVSSCCDFDFHIPTKYTTEMNSFEKGDTIYFESNLKDFDTIRITGIDSKEECGTFGMVAPYSDLNLRIEHLPKNKWNDGITVSNQNGEKTMLNQSLISIRKSAGNIDSEKPEVWIHYRDFWAELSVSTYDSIEVITLLDNETDKNIDSIDEIYWSNQIGITGYRKRDGQVYRRKNVP